MAGNPLDQLDGTEYASAAIGTLVATWQPPYTPTTATAETLAMSMVFTTDDNEIGLVAGSEQGFTHSYAATSDVSRDRAMALATRELTSASTLTMPTYEQLTMAPDEWSGVFIAVAATSPSVAEVMFTFPPTFTLALVVGMPHCPVVLFSKPPAFIAGVRHSHRRRRIPHCLAPSSPGRQRLSPVRRSRRRRASPHCLVSCSPAHQPSSLVRYSRRQRTPRYPVSCFPNRRRFTAGAVQSATVAVVVPAYVGEVIRMEIEVFSAGQVWLDARVADESLWSGTFTGDNEINAGLFIGRVQWRNSGDRMTINRTNASTNTTVGCPQCRWGTQRPLHACDTFWDRSSVHLRRDHEYDTRRERLHARRVWYGDSGCYCWWHRDHRVCLPTWLAGLPTTVTLSGALFSKSPSFPAGAVQAPSAEITLSGAPGFHIADVYCGCSTSAGAG